MSGFETTRQCVDRFYNENGPCCAGCDYWRYHNALVGDCIASSPVSGEERMAMLGLESCSLPAKAGHVLTPREHWCGNFKDEEISEAI